MLPPAPTPPGVERGTAASSEPRTPAETLAYVLGRTCLPFVADRTPAEAATAAARLRLDWPAPAFPSISHETGRLALGRWPGLVSVRLRDEPVSPGSSPVRSCTILIRGREDAVLEPALEAALRDHSGALAPAPSALPGRPTFKTPGARVVVSNPDEVARYGEKEADVFEAPVASP